MHQPQKGGFFNRLKDQILRPLIEVPGSGGKEGQWYDCVFCEGTGVIDCDACNGTGRDALGVCLMCKGKTTLTCLVCNGSGVVDRVRRGGTDDNNQYTKKKKRNEERVPTLVDDMESK